MILKFRTKKISRNIIIQFLPFTLLCIATAYSGHEYWKGSVFLTLIVIAIISLLSNMSIKKNFSGIELFVFTSVIVMEFFIRILSRESYYDWQLEFNAILLFIMMVVCVALIVRRENIEMIWKVINVFSIISSCLVIIQWIALFTGLRLDKIPGLGNTFFNAYYFQFFRPCSIFSEPSHLAEFCLLSLCYYLMIEGSVKKSIIPALGCILSTSSLGILGSILLYAIFYVNIKKIEMKKSKRIKITLLIILISVIFSVWIENTNNLVFSRVLSGGTYGVRTMRSFELFDELSSFEKIFGIGIQNQSTYLNYNSIVLNSDALETLKNREFAQTFGYLLCTTGILGVGILCCTFLNVLRRGDFKILSFIILFSFVCFTCCVFSRFIFVVYLIAIFSISLKTRKT